MSRYTLQPGMIVPQTPFYYCDIDLLQRTLQTATTEAARYGYQIHYAMKANAEPHILYEIQQAGLGADCVSGYEVECAIEKESEKVTARSNTPSVRAFSPSTVNPCRNSR